MAIIAIIGVSYGQTMPVLWWNVNKTWPLKKSFKNPGIHISKQAHIGKAAFCLTGMLQKMKQ